VNYCKDCRWARPFLDPYHGRDYSLARCVRPELDRNPVTGQVVETWCESERRAGPCGPSGQLFEQKLWPGPPVTLWGRWKALWEEIG
jgi:hypothetical protein